MSQNNEKTPPSSWRRMSNPFTKNQDAAAEAASSSSSPTANTNTATISAMSPVNALIGRFRNASIGSHGSGTIDEEEDEEGNSLDPVPFRQPGEHGARLGSATGSGTGVFELASQASPSDHVPDGLPFKPTLRPAGGSQRHVDKDDLQNPDKLYAQEQGASDSSMPTSRSSSSTGDSHPFTGRSRGIIRTYSMGQQKRRPVIMNDDRIIRQRRLSHDLVPDAPRRFIVDVEDTMRMILEQEDTDGNFQISITDSGPKVFNLGTATSNGYKGFDIRGTYMLSNLLQELAIARDHGRKRIMLDESRLTENPVDRLSRMISQTFWHNLTRRIDADGLEAILADPKNRSKSRNPRIYVPSGEPEMFEYYKQVAAERPSMNLQVELLPKNITSDYTRDLNDKPGLLALAMKKGKDSNGKETLQGVPFIVPGARFNELYNWDSYFISLGLVVDDMVDMAKGIVEHFIFNIKHYHKVLNGNRSYYLMRAQPPFLTDMALQVYSRLDHTKEEENKQWLLTAMRAAIKEYHTVWMAEPRLDRKTGLSRYRPEGRGVPPETEASHFTHILRPYAEKYGCSVNEFTRKYNEGEIQSAELDEYFMHDRAVRESGHDTTYRFEKRCANLATIDLNALLYKYEVDIGTAIKELFDDQLELVEDFVMHAPLPDGMPQPDKPSRSIETPQTSAEWFARAAFRKKQVDKYCWNEGMALYYDYDTAREEQSVYESVTTFWAMWAGLASERQADLMVRKSLKKFEVVGGLVPGTEDSRGKISLDRPNRQWDYPFAWPPHQMLTWVGMERYGYLEEARRLVYRWLYMITVAVVDFNGCVPEKFDAVKLSHMVDAEYGNQGVDFKYVVKEGFGWTNASFQVGLTFLDTKLRRALSVCQDPETLFGKN